jgi:hypothetical protein
VAAAGHRVVVALGAGVAALLVAAAVAAGVEARMASQLTIPLDPAIPNERVLIARGLAGVPSRSQRTYPIAVDRVVTDGAATYVQFRITGSLGRFPNVIPDLYDDTGAAVNYGGGAGLSPAGWTLPLPSWVPWHPPVVRRGYATLGPLPLTARAGVLRFMNGETVRVPLNLTALRQRRAYSGPLVQRNGLQFQVAAARDTGLVLSFSPFGDPRGVTLADADARGRTVPVRAVSSGCSSRGFADVHLACRAVWAYPPQLRGTRLTLAIQSFAADSSGAVANVVGSGPWRYTFTIP